MKKKSNKSNSIMPSGGSLNRSNIPKLGASLEIESMENIKLPFKEVYEMGEQIGSGGYGIVYKGHHVCHPNKTLAIKALRRKGRQDEQQAWREMSILRRVRNVPNVVRLIDFYIEKDQMYCVQELAEGGDLLDHIQVMFSTGETYTEKEARDFATFLFTTICAVHKCGVVHRDLKPENFLLKNDNDDTELLLCDFGLARILPADGSSVLSDFAGTLAYMSPEVFDHKNKEHGKPVDMWSAGCILYMLLGGYLPFGQDDDARGGMADSIKSGRFDFDHENWDFVSREAKELICNLLKVDPNERWTAAEALKSDWFIHVSERSLSMTDLSCSIETMKEYVARRKFKAAFHAVRWSNRNLFAKRSSKKLDAEQQSSKEPNNNNRLQKTEEKSRGRLNALVSSSDRISAAPYSAVIKRLDDSLNPPTKNETAQEGTQKPGVDDSLGPNSNFKLAASPVIQDQSRGLILLAKK